MSCEIDQTSRHILNHCNAQRIFSEPRGSKIGFALLNAPCVHITYEPGQIVEFHRMAKGAVRSGVQEKRFKSGEQWEVLRREEGAVIVGKEGVEKQLPLD